MMAECFFFKYLISSIRTDCLNSPNVTKIDILVFLFTASKFVWVSEIRINEIANLLHPVRSIFFNE